IHSPKLVAAPAIIRATANATTLVEGGWGFSGPAGWRRRRRAVSILTTELLLFGKAPIRLTLVELLSSLAPSRIKSQREALLTAFSCAKAQPAPVGAQTRSGH